jgi:Tfp pilus assembly protein PilV
MEAVVNIGISPNPRRSRQAGFSLIEFLLAAFVMAIGILGLTMLQVMSLRGGTGSRALNTAVVVGEGVLESIQAEGRQSMLFLKAQTAAPTATYFVTGPLTQYYAFDGTLLANATNSFYKVQIANADVVALSAAGGTKRFTLTITFTDSVTPTTTILRTVTLTRQVAYA